MRDEQVGGFFSWRWLLTTLLALAAVALLIRLGMWQLDRLAQRRAFNARVQAQLAAPELDMNQATRLDNLYDMEYRAVKVTGRYDHSQEVLLRNQVWQGQIGFHVLAPLKIEGYPGGVLVDRGWIPFEQAQQRRAFQEQGLVTVKGIIRRPQSKPDFGGVPDPTLAPGQTRLEAWNIVNLERIQQQVDMPLLPVYIQQAPSPSWTRLPYRSLPQLELSEGPHLGYALQWFTFAAILALGYPYFVWRQLHGSASADQPSKAWMTGKEHKT